MLGQHKEEGRKPNDLDLLHYQHQQIIKLLTDLVAGELEGASAKRHQQILTALTQLRLQVFRGEE